MKYIVENQRPRRSLSVLGRTLAPKGRGRTSRISLELAELLDHHCVRLLKVGRLRVIGANPPELDALLSEDEEVLAEPEVVAAPPAPEHAETVERGSVVPDGEAEDGGTSEDGEPSEEPSGEEGSSGADPEDDGTTPPDPLQDTEKVWTEDELFALNAADQKTICRSRGLKLGGKEADRVARILDAQEA